MRTSQSIDRLQPEAPSIEIDCKCNQSSWQRRLARKQKQSKRPFFPKNKHQRELLQVDSQSNGGLDCMPIQLTPVIAAKTSTFAREKCTYIAQFSTLHMECKKVEKVDGPKRHGALL